jgi:mono/diheme cytochrome c family protein
MQPSGEDYTRYLQIGLSILIILIGGLTVYALTETNRLGEAAGDFSSQRILRGQKVYAMQCQSCHGANGEGSVGPALNNKTLLDNTADRILFSIIRSGVPNTQMPAWGVENGGPLTDEDVRDVVAKIRSWQPDAPVINPITFAPEPSRGAVLFASTCAICHGENGSGTDRAPMLNNPARLAALPDDWYRDTIKNGRPAKGMPTWGTVLSPEQIDDLVSLISAWRAGKNISPNFSITDLIDQTAFALENNDNQSAELEINRALPIVGGAAAQILKNALAQIQSGDNSGALESINGLQEQWPLGDPSHGAATYSANCAACHGVQGEGGVGPGLFGNEFIQSQTNADLVSFIEAGRPGTAMAGFKDRLGETELADVVAFLRLWQK